MTETVSKRTSNYKPYFTKEELHKTYGGEIYISDFEIGHSKSPNHIANRIAKDKRFDEQCKKDLLNIQLQRDFAKGV